MNVILFPTDFSPCSHNAFLYAVRLAQLHRAQLITLHVYQSAATLIPADYQLAWDVVNEHNDWDELDVYKEEINKLRKVAATVEAGNLPMQHLLDKGDVAESIVKMAGKHRADCIVMGTKGAHAFDALFGTMAEKVMNLSDTSVIMVPDKWHHKAISRILFLTQFEKKDQKVLRKILNFAMAVSAKVTALWFASDTVNREQILGDWYERFENDDVIFKILTGRDVSENIKDYLGSHPVELVALTTVRKNAFQRTFFHSIAEDLAVHAYVPLMTVRGSR